MNATVWNAKIGDSVFVDGIASKVTDIRIYDPGHSIPAIRSDWYCVEVITENGNRYCGHNPEVVGSFVAGLFNY